MEKNCAQLRQYKQLFGLTEAALAQQIAECVRSARQECQQQGWDRPSKQAELRQQLKQQAADIGKAGPQITPATEQELRRVIQELPQWLPQLEALWEQGQTEWLGFLQQHRWDKSSPTVAAGACALALMTDVYNARGRLYTLAKAPEQARTEFRRAWESYEQFWGGWLTSLGVGETSQYAEAKRAGMPTPTTHRGCLTLLGLETRDYLWSADASLAAGHYAKALEQYDRVLAAEAGKPSVPLEVQVTALRAIGTVQEKQGHKAQAAQSYQQAIALVEQLQGAIRLEQLIATFAGVHVPVYTQLITLLLDLGEPARAFEYTGAPGPGHSSTNSGTRNWTSARPRHSSWPKNNGCSPGSPSSRIA